MIQIFNEIVSNKTLLIVGAWFGELITIALIIVLLKKSSRDERGKAIIGKASIISTFLFIILVNFVCKMLADMELTYITVGVCIQWIYNIVLAVEFVAILIYKRIE